MTRTFFNFLGKTKRGQKIKQLTIRSVLCPTQKLVKLGGKHVHGFRNRWKRYNVRLLFLEYHLVDSGVLKQARSFMSTRRSEFGLSYSMARSYVQSLVKNQ